MTSTQLWYFVNAFDVYGDELSWNVVVPLASAVKTAYPDDRPVTFALFFRHSLEFEESICVTSEDEAADFHYWLPDDSPFGVQTNSTGPMFFPPNVRHYRLNRYIHIIAVEQYQNFRVRVFGKGEVPRFPVAHQYLRLMQPTLSTMEGEAIRLSSHLARRRFAQDHQSFFIPQQPVNRGTLSFPIEVVYSDTEEEEEEEEDVVVTYDSDADMFTVPDRYLPESDEEVVVTLRLTRSGCEY